MVGMERTILPLIAKTDYGLASQTATLSFLVSFGIVKALSNLFAGRFSERIGRKRILVTGWVAGLGVHPFDPGSELGLGGFGQCAPGYQPGILLVYHRHNEDRSGRTQAPRHGDGVQRSGRLPGCLILGFSDRVPGRLLWPPPGPLPAGDRFRLFWSAAFDHLCARNASLCSIRSGEPSQFRRTGEQPE